MLKSFSMLVLLMAAVPALAGSPDGKAKDPKRRVCQSVEETGSRLSSKRICMTAEQWEAQRERNGRDAERTQKSSGAAGGK